MFQTFRARLVLVGALLTGGLLIGTAVWAGVVPTVVVVDENNATWGFLVESGTPTSGYIQGPATPPLGGGSGSFGLTGGTDGVAIGTLLHAGQRLDEITLLTYATHQSGTPQAPALQMNLDYDASDTTTSWQGRLVYEPYHTQTVLAGTWQSWDALLATGTGNWWSTGTPVVGNTPSAAVCVMSNPCTWTELLTAYPNAAIHQGALGALLLKAGSGWPAGYAASIDALRLQHATADVTYNFETVLPVELQSFSVE